jgi:hypothetical protein
MGSDQKRNVPDVMVCGVCLTSYGSNSSDGQMVDKNYLIYGDARSRK